MKMTKPKKKSGLTNKQKNGMERQGVNVNELPMNIEQGTWKVLDIQPEVKGTIRFQEGRELVIQKQPHQAVCTKLKAYNLICRNSIHSKLKLGKNIYFEFNDKRKKCGSYLKGTPVNFTTVFTGTSL